MILDINEDDVLILIDIQNDFLSGTLTVPDGLKILPRITLLSQEFSNIILTQDWHGENHKSFASSHDDKKPFDVIDMPYGKQTLWPSHCVAGSWGSEIHLNDKILNKSQMTIRKGYNDEEDSYSAFFGAAGTPTGLGGYMAERGFKRAFFAGLALDYCVAYSAIDCAKLGFETLVATNACKGIAPNTVEMSMQAMTDNGVTFI